MKKILYIAAFSTLLYACKKADADCTDTNYTYEADTKKIISNNCNTAGCHNSGSSNGDFTTYAKLKPYLDSEAFYNRVFVVGDMPKNRILNLKNKNILQCWVENSYKEN